MAKALSNNQKKELAYELYMSTDYSQKEICELVGWTEQTFSKYKQKEGWEKLKGANLLTADKIINRLYERLEQLIESDKFKADDIAKIASSIDKLKDRKATISGMINTFKEFTTFLIELDPTLAKMVNKYQDQFVKMKVNAQ